MNSGWEFGYQGDKLKIIAVGDEADWDALPISAATAREILLRRDDAGEVLGVNLKRTGTQFRVNVVVWSNGDATFFLHHPRAVIKENIPDFDWYRTNLANTILESMVVLSINWEEVYG